MDNKTKQRILTNRKAIFNGIDEKERLFEMSISEKNKLFRQAFRAIDGVEDNVHTFCIITGENPMGVSGSNFTNRTNDKFIVDYLKKSNYAWQPVRGCYGKEETIDNNGNTIWKPTSEYKTKIIFNIRLTDAKEIAFQTQQESFIYGRKENGRVYFDLYFKINNEYVLVETQDKVLDMSGEDCYYTQLGKRRFNIPFEFFNESCITYNKAIAKRKQKSSLYKANFDRLLYRVLDESRIGNNLHNWKGYLHRGLFD